MRILGTDGTVLRDWRPRPGERANPEIDRGQLRDLLLGPPWTSNGARTSPRSCRTPPAASWCARQTGAPAPTTWWSAPTAPGPASEAPCHPPPPRYTGVTLLETSLDDVDTTHPDLARLIGDGALAVYGVNRAVVAQRNSGGHVKVYAQFRAPPRLAHRPRPPPRPHRTALP
ncbi:hypothetical protein GCM10020001_106770 [Nonomuraea salmonea]